MIRLKRAYEKPASDDGPRYLVDRLWPRGIPKNRLKLADWLKELAPSDDLRQWYGHDPQKWSEFKRRYKLELRAAAKQAQLDELAGQSERGAVTLVYAARDTEHNNAVVLKEVIEHKRPF